MSDYIVATEDKLKFFIVIRRDIGDCPQHPACPFDMITV